MKRFLIVLLALPMLGKSNETIPAKLGTETAWVGEGVPLLIILWAKGPFSGTASFDLPETDQTFFIKEGSPSVDTETRDGETWLTQSHAFRIYTQKSGPIAIPPIHVRFEAKKNYVSIPEPHAGSTKPLSFHSRRPPGTEGMLVSVEKMTVEQRWTGGTEEQLKPGDVVIRHITRTADKTTGMIFPNADLSAPDGIQVYAERPEILDQSYRGETTAKRVDVIKYQLSCVGTFTLPDLVFSWWNPRAEQLETTILAGAEFEVMSEPYPAHPGTWFGLLLLLPLLFLAYSKLRNMLNRPERLSRKRVIMACRAEDPKATYAAVLAWKKLPFSSEFSKVWKPLSEVLYRNASSDWESRAFEKEFIKECRRIRANTKRSTDPLAPLNPGR